MADLNYTPGPNYSSDPNVDNMEGYDPFADWEALKKLQTLASHQASTPDALGVSRGAPPTQPLPLASAHQGGGTIQRTGLELGPNADQIDPQQVLAGLKMTGPMPTGDNLGVGSPTPATSRVYQPGELQAAKDRAAEVALRNEEGRVGNRYLPEQRQATATHQAAPLIASLVEGTGTRADGTPIGSEDIVAPRYHPSPLAGRDEATGMAVGTESPNAPSITGPEDEAREAAKKDAAIMRAYRNAMPGLASLDAMNAAAMGADANAMLAGYKPIFEPLETKLIEERGKAQEALGKGKSASAEHDVNSAYSKAMQIQAIGSPQFEQLAARLSEATGDSIEQTKADLYKNHISKMSPYAIKQMFTELGKSGDYTAQQATTSMQQAQEKSEMARLERLGYENRDARASLEAKWTKGSATSALARQAVAETFPALTKAPGFWNMSAGEIQQQWPQTQNAIEIAGRVAVNSREVLRNSQISSTESFNIIGGSGPGIGGLVTTTMGSEGRRQQYLKDKQVHAGAWEVGQDVLEDVARMGGLEAAAKTKVNSKEGAVLKQRLNRFANAYEQATGDKQTADGLRGDNLLDILWGAGGKGAKLMDALTGLQTSTEVYKGDVKNTDLFADGEGPPTPPLGLPFRTSFEGGQVIYHFFDPATQRVFEYKRIRPGIWQHRQLRPSGK